MKTKSSETTQSEKRLPGMKRYALAKPIPDRGKILKNTLAIFLSLFTLMIAVTTLNLLVIENTEMNEIKDIEQRVVNIQTEKIQDNILQTVAELKIIANGNHIKRLWDDDGNPILQVMEALSEDFLNIAIYREIYDQVRLIDEHGKEIIRVNFNNGYPGIVPREKLQNKKGRYYFDDAFKLNREEVFISPLDLNIERGKIEEPLKPMIRFATPVFDHRGMKRGIVLQNYFGATMIKHLTNQADLMTTSHIMLINTQGYWLKGLKSEDEWGFMYEDRKDRTFANAYPEVWDRILQDGASQLETSHGMFTFKTIYPLIEGQKTSTGSGKAFSPSIAQLEAKEYYWVVVSFVPSKLLHDYRNKRRIYVAVALALLALASFYGVWPAYPCHRSP